MNVSAGAPPAPPGPRDRRAATRGDPPAGLKDPEDIFLTTWNVAIMGPLSTVYENRLYSCELARPGALRARAAPRGDASAARRSAARGTRRSRPR